MKKLSTLVFLLISLYTFSLKRNVPATYTTIQAALNACSIGDTVLVQPGTYTENIYWPKIKNIKLFSAGDSSNTFIDANFVGRCLTIIDSSKTIIDTNTIISGFKLKNGYSDTTSFNGVAIYGYGVGPIIQNCAITNCNINAVNTTTLGVINGGVIYFESQVPKLKNSSLYNNTIYNSYGNINGGIIYIGKYQSMLSTLNIFNNQVSILAQGPNNIKGAFIYCDDMNCDQIKVQNNLVNYYGSGTSSFYSFLYGKGITCDMKNSLIINNTFSTSATVNITSLVLFGSATSGGGTTNLYHLTITDNRAITMGNITAISFYGNSGSNPYPWSKRHYIYNCIFWNPYNAANNEVAGVSSSYCFIGVSFTDIRKCVLWTTNCFSVNPQFISSSDYHLQISSPCINAGVYNLNYDLENNLRPNPNPSFPDIGCYEMNQPTSSLTPSASAATNTTCAYSSPCFYNSTPKTKNRVWSISPSVPGWPYYQDTVCKQIYPSGTYTVSLMVTDSSNAIGTSSFVIIAYPIPTVMPTSTGSNICTGQSATLTSSYTGTTSTVLWSNGATSPTTIVSPTVSTTYTFTYTNIYGCGRSGSYVINYTVSPPPSTTITASSNPICVGQSVTLTATSTGSIYGYNWKPSGNTSSIVVSPSVNTTYTATIYNPYSCTDDTTITITVSLCTDVKGNILTNSEIIISPNPNNGEFILSTAIKENGFFEIYNCVGQKIKSGNVIEKTQISLREESPGIYFIKVFENKKLISTKKIVLN